MGTRRSTRLAAFVWGSVSLALLAGCQGQQTTAGGAVAKAPHPPRRPRPRVEVPEKLTRFLYGGKSIGQWLVELDSPDPKRRQPALLNLGAIGPDAVFLLPVLSWGLEDEDARVRAAAATGVGFTSPDAAGTATVLRDFVKRESPDSAFSAIGALGVLAHHTGRPEPVAALVDLSRDARPGVRSAAVDQLGLARPVTEPAVLRLLELAATEPGSSIGRKAASSLEELGVAAVPGLLAAIDDRRPAVAKLAVGRLIELKKDARSAGSAVPALAKALRHESWTTRWLAAGFLADMGDAAKDAAPALIAALDDTTAVVAMDAVRALSAIGPEAAGAVPALLHTLRSAARDAVRSAAAYALRPLAPEDGEVLVALLEATPALVRAHREETGGTEPEMAGLLGQTERPEADEVRAAVDSAIGKVGPASVPAAREGLRREDPIARQAAAYLLGTLGGDAEPALDDLIAAGADPDAAVRAEAARAIGALGPRASKAAPTLRRALGDEDPGVRGAAASALGRVGLDPASDLAALEKLLEDPETEFEAAAALASAGGEAGSRGAAVLIAELQGIFPSPRALEAEEALAALGAAAVPELTKALEANREASFAFARIASVLGEIGPEAKAAVPILRGSLASKSSIVRLNAARALAKIGPGAKEAEPELRRCLEDADEVVRKAAEEALGKIGAE